MTAPARPHVAAVEVWTGDLAASLAFYRAAGLDIPDHDPDAPFAAAYHRLLAAGHHGHLPPFDGAWGARFAVVHDPDGNPVGLTSPL